MSMIEWQLKEIRELEDIYGDLMAVPEQDPRLHHLRHALNRRQSNEVWNYLAEQGAIGLGLNIKPLPSYEIQYILNSEGVR